MDANQDVFNELNENGVFYRKDLISYIEWLATTMTWASGDPHTLPGGQTPEDVAHEVIKKALDGTRNYDPDKGPFRYWLRDQARSELNHLAESAVHRREVELLEDELIPDARSTNPEGVLIAQEDQDTVSQSVAAIFEVVDGDSDLHEIAEAITNGCEPYPRYLAEELSLEVTEVNNRLRRLRRLLRKGKLNRE